MEKLRTLKTVVYVVAALLAAEIGLLVVMVRPSAFLLWATIGIIAVLCIYLIRITLAVIKELEKTTKNKL